MEGSPLKKYDKVGFGCAKHNKIWPCANRSGVGNSFGFAGHIREKLGIRGPVHVHVN